MAGGLYIYFPEGAGGGGRAGDGGDLAVMEMSSLSAQDADLALCRSEGGVEMALQYTKMWCRYAKDLLGWMEKRIGLGE